jgi:hypothetical protein
MSFDFDRPVGATADTQELDFIAALHQTDVEAKLRKDGSIEDNDISLFLSSRYGVQVTPEEVRETILDGLGGTGGYMDMMQLVSLLMVPVLRQEQHDREFAGNESQNENDLLLFTIEMLLHDVTGSRQPKLLTKTLLRQILCAYGEDALAEDDELINQMMKQSGALHNRVLLDASTFLKALTADVQDFDVNNKDKLTTFFDDIMGSSNNNNESGSNMNDSSHQKRRNPAKTMHWIDSLPKCSDSFVSTTFTAPHIDNTADTFRSRPLVIWQWAFFILSFQTYLIGELNQKISTFECTEFDPLASFGANVGAFACTLGWSVLSWIIIMLLMSIVGFFYFGLGGIGNNVDCKRLKYPAIGVLVSALAAFLPFFLLALDDQDPRQQHFLEITTVVVGVFVVVLVFWHFVVLLIPETSVLRECFKSIFVSATARTEYNLKQAAVCKTKKMVENALEVHRVKKQESVVPTHFGQALLNFAEMTPKYERIGSFWWTLRSIWNRSLSRHEGLLFPARTMSTNFLQFVVAIFILIAGIGMTIVVSSSFEDLRNALIESIVMVVDIDAISEDIPLNQEVFNRVTEEAVRIFFPTDQYMVVVPLATGAAIAFAAAFFISIVVLPSTVSTTMKLRCGVLPFVLDPEANLLRKTPDHTAFLRAQMYYGCFFASLLLGGVCGIGLFLCLWQITAAVVQLMAAQILGALTVLGIHSVVTWSIRQVAASAFYRRKPAIANITLLVRECGLVALTQGFVVLRIIRLFFTTCLYAGRLDTPFLYRGIGELGSYRVDTAPYLFQIDILQHEAHRHPYIETLGTMYLLKLRHKDSFSTKAGSTWRLVFVYLLMPWLSKYRAFRRPEIKSDVEDGLNNTAVRPPLRAVTLVDPQAYALRAVSLVPAASGWTSGVSRNLSIARPLTQERNEDRTTHLEEENRQLRLQLEALAASAHKQSPHESSTVDGKTPRFQVDDYGRIIAVTKETFASHDNDIESGRISNVNQEQLPKRPRPLHRAESKGLAASRPPVHLTPVDNDDATHVTWADDNY